MGLDVNAVNAQKFDNWTNDEKNYQKALNGEKVDEFQMFDFNASTYSSDLKNFAHEYINLYDANGDGVWDKNEFVKMALGENDIPKELESAYADYFAKSFDALNLDNNKDAINAGEFATMLYASDLDWNNYAQTGDIASSLDGKADYAQYQGFSSMVEGDDSFDILKNERKDFYDAFYGE